MKGAVEEVISRFVISDVTFAPDELPAWIEPGRGARIALNGDTAGWFGELTATECDKRKLRETVVMGEVLIPQLFTSALRQPSAQEPSRYQAVERDLSFVFADTVCWADVATALRGLDIVEMISLAPVEIFRDPKGKTVPRGRLLTASAHGLSVIGSHPARRGTHGMAGFRHCGVDKAGRATSRRLMPT